MNTFPILALGTWTIGGLKDPNPNNDDQKDIKIIKTAVDNDVTLIDTAQNYANGRCEELIGQALQGMSRDSFQILDKQRKERLQYSQVIEDVDLSLSRLGVDYIDYFFCHAPTNEEDVREFFRATNELIRSGKIKNVGVSNFGPNMLRVALETSEHPIVANQIHVSTVDDDAETTGTIEFCQQNNIAVQAYRPIMNIRENQKSFDVVKSLSKKYEVSPEQIVLAYLHSKYDCVFTIKSSSKQHWDEIKSALEISLSQKDIDEIYNSYKNTKGQLRHFLEV